MTETMGDNIKLGFALLLLVAGVVGFYMLSDQATIVRVLCIFAGIGASVAVVSLTAPGQQFFDFARDSINETRKVVWPTRKETFQTTGVVFLFVLAMAIMLWVTDKSLEWLLYDVVLGWKK
jgi:preprotein translocase subunit SecE